MKISNDAVTLRAVEPSDLDFLYRLENEPERDDVSFFPAPVSRFQLEQYIAGYTADIYADKQLRLIVEDMTGEAVGVVDLTDFEPRSRRAFVGITVIGSRRGHGIGRGAIDLLCRYASETLGVHTLVALVGAGNTASLALFRSCEFKSCGRLRSWIRSGSSYSDALLFQRLFAI